MNSYEKIQRMRRRSESIVLALVGRDATQQWWSSRNKAFEMKTPEEMFEKNPEVVYNYLVGHVDGYG